MTFASLAAGAYRFTIATYNNFANGTQLSQGSSFDNQTPIPVALWDQLANSNNLRGIFYSVHLDGVSSAVSAVSEPESYAMLLAGLGLMGVIARRCKQA